MFTPSGLQLVAHRSEIETTDRQPVNSRTTCWLAAALIVGLLLRVHCLFFPFLWLDEFVTLWSIGGATYGEMLNRSLHWTASGPLFVLCYRASSDLVGDVEWGLKLPGVIFGTFSVWAAWWTARQLFDRRDVALTAAWLVALAPQFIHFSQEGRPYMIGSLLVMLATGFLAAWLRNHRWYELTALVALSLAAVGFHLLVALALVAQNLFVLLYGFRSNWLRRHWLEWFAAQLAVAVGLWFAGAQFRMLSGRHGSMILETNLPMLTRQSLDGSLPNHFRIGLLIALVGMIFWWFARRFPNTTLAQAWNQHGAMVSLAASGYLVPTVLLTCLSALRVVDCWGRYYFLFHGGFMIALAWTLVCAFSRLLSRSLTVVVIASMLCHFNCVRGIPSCRLNGIWSDFSEAESELRRRTGPDDLVLSRSGLIEANHLRFLRDSTGSSYLKCFYEAKNGPLPAQHIPLPFSPECAAMERYLVELFSETVLKRGDFWLVNVAPLDFDYEHWIEAHYGDRFRVTEKLVYPCIIMCHFATNPEPEELNKESLEKKGTSDWVPATVSKVPCQRSMLE